MSINLVDGDLRDQDCKNGKVTQGPLISYAQFKCKPWVSKPERIKIKLTEGNTLTCNLMNDSSNTEAYLKWILVYLHVREEKKLDEKLTRQWNCSRRYRKKSKSSPRFPGTNLWVRRQNRNLNQQLPI
jgi:hypothetical protein